MPLTSASNPEFSPRYRVLLVLVLLLQVGCVTPGHRPSRTTAAGEGQDPRALALFIEAQVLLARAARGLDGGGQGRQLETRRAVFLLEQALALEPSSASLHRYLAEAHSLQGDPRAALRSVRSALALNPKDCQAHLMLGTQLLELAQLEESVEGFQAALLCGLPSELSSEGFFWLFEAQRRLEREGEAVATLEAWVSTLPADRHARSSQASYLWSLGLADQARDAVVGALLGGSEEAGLRRILGDYYLDDRRGEADVLQRVVERNPGSVVHRRRLVESLWEADRPDLAMAQLRYLPPEERVGGLSQAQLKLRLLVAMHSHQEAQRLLDVLEEEASAPRRSTRVWLYESAGELEEALALLRSVETSGEDRTVEARLLRKLGRPSESLVLLEQTIAQFPSLDPEARVRLELERFSSALALEDYAAAQHSLEAVEVRDARLARRLTMQLLEGQGRLEEALALLGDAEGGWERRRLILLTGKHRGAPAASAWVERWLVELDRRLQQDIEGSPRSSRHELRRQARLDRIDVLLQLYWAEHEFGEREAAEQILRRVLDIDPNRAIALNALAYLLAEDGRDLEEAAQLSSQALEQRPFSGAFVDTLAWVRHRQGRHVEARELILKALHYAPGEPEILEHLRAIEAALSAPSSAAE